MLSAEVRIGDPVAALAVLRQVDVDRLRDLARRKRDAPDRPGGTIRRAVAKTREGTPALLEFITEKAEDFSMFA